MEESENSAEWMQTLELNWMGREREKEQLQWLKERNDAVFHWARNRVVRQVVALEKELPLDAEEEAFLRDFDTKVEVVIVVLSENEREYELMQCAIDDFPLLARAGFFDFWLDKLRAEYEAGRFPRGAL